MTQLAPLRIVAVGDVSFNGRYHRLLEQNGEDYPFRRIMHTWQGADLVLGNLESPITRAARVAPTKLTLRAAACAARSLRAARFDCVCLANNHAMDFGPDGLCDTIGELDAQRIASHGAGVDASSASAPVIIHRRGYSVGLLAYCSVEQSSKLYAERSEPGVSPLDSELACKQIRQLKCLVDWVVVQLHWGTEMSRLPSPTQRDIARKLVAAGSDVILGHHPHVLQPLEWVDGVPVFYSLGNFLFSDMYWRGQAGTGEQFTALMRVHRLSRETGWAEIMLRPHGPSRASLRPARLGHDMAINTSGTARWSSAMPSGGAFDEHAFIVEYEREGRLAEKRKRWSHGGASIAQRARLKLFSLGLIPFAPEAK
jgi:poly-gamma-glutamate synthesis protein (capsule biosynthesis protein)